MAQIKSVYEAIKELKEMDDKKTLPQSSLVSRPKTSLSQTNDINQKIINKIFSLSKALSDEFGLDQRMVMEDIIKDLRIAGGEEIIDVIKGETPFDQLSKQMALTAREIGMDSNMALNSLLMINERDYVEAFRQFISSGRAQLPNFVRTQVGQRDSKTPKMLTTKKKFSEDLMESIFNRIMLTESIEDIYSKYYSDIKREMFDKLIGADPTFNKELDKLGDYGKWILNSYKQKRIKDRDLENVREVLNDFNDRKRFITTPEMRDINKYKSLEEIRTSLNNIELTKNQIAKMARKAKHTVDLGEDAEFIGENSQWEIWSPKTYAASCSLGSQTKWCTASTSDDYYYKNYSSKGKLYAFIPKDGDVQKKHQLHILKGENKVYDFRDFLDKYSGGSPYEFFVSFITKYDLKNTLLQTELKNIDAIKDIENIERIKKGEPYIYSGGKIKEMHKEFIKIVRFDSEYNEKTIPMFAFKDCTKMEEIYIPDIVVSFGLRSFDGCDKVTIFTTKRRIAAYDVDIPFLKTKIKYVEKI